MYIKSGQNNTIIIEKSRFITYLKRVKSEQEYKDYLALIKKKHYDANHVCSAFVCHNIKRSSDDGEPSGTAGIPMLNVLEKNNLDEICAIVVRYFGGIKLGTGGLSRAYSNSIRECLTKTSLIEEKTFNAYELSLSYELANKIEYYLKKNTILLNIRYEELITYEFALKEDEQMRVILEYTKGIKPTPKGSITIEV